MNTNWLQANVYCDPVGGWSPPEMEEAKQGRKGGKSTNTLVAGGE